MTTTTTSGPVSAQQLIADLKLENVFRDENLRHDLVEGTVLNPTETRQIYLSTDLIRGIYLALKEEAGPAWSGILKNCGRLWGARVVKNLEKEFQLIQQMNPGELPINAFTGLMERYFSAHGWGVATIDMTDAASCGIISMRLKNSLLASVLEEEDEPTDSLIAGILQGIFSHYSGAALDCVELASSRQGYPDCWFVISHEDRIAEIEELGDPQKRFRKLKGIPESEE